MTDTSSSLNSMSCSDVALLLEQEVQEERLTTQEQQAVSHHLKSCQNCSDFVKLTRHLPIFADTLSEGEIDVAVKDIINQATQSAHSNAPQTSRRIALPLIALAASLLVGLALFALLTNRTASSLECAPSAPRELTDGVFISYCTPLDPEIVVGENRDVTITLRDGTLGLFIDPRRQSPRKVTVKTQLGAVRAKGTVFTVEVENDDIRVEVFSGLVEVSPPSSKQAVLEIPAGNGASLRNKKTFRLTKPRTEILRQTLARDITHQKPAFPSPVAETSDTSSSQSPQKSEIESVDSDDPTKGGQHVAPSRRSDSTLRGYQVSIDAHIQEAQSCLIDRDWQCAASHYRKVLKRHAKRPESMTALISLAKIELRHLGAPQKALEHYRTYHKRAPNGPLAEEALLGMADAYRRLGMEDKEQMTLHLFVEKYPQSPLIKKARSRLK